MATPFSGMVADLELAIPKRYSLTSLSVRRNTEGRPEARFCVAVPGKGKQRAAQAQNAGFSNLARGSTAPQGVGKNSAARRLRRRAAGRAAAQAAPRQGNGVATEPSPEEMAMPVAQTDDEDVFVEAAEEAPPPLSPVAAPADALAPAEANTVTPAAQAVGAYSPSALCKCNLGMASICPVHASTRHSPSPGKRPLSPPATCQEVVTTTTPRWALATTTAALGAAVTPHPIDALTAAAPPRSNAEIAEISAYKRSKGIPNVRPSRHPATYTLGHWG